MIADIKRVDLEVLLADLPEDPRLALVKICTRVQDALDRMDQIKERPRDYGLVDDTHLLDFDQFLRECNFITRRWCERTGLPVPETEGADPREVWRNLLDHAYRIAGTSSAER